MAKLVCNLTSEARHVMDGLGIVNRPPACFGNISHEVSAVPATAATASP